jgi:hypothetical protein
VARPGEAGLDGSFRREVWEYNLDIAAEAAENGFDEIHSTTCASRTPRGCLRAAHHAGEPDQRHRRLPHRGKAAARPYNAFLSADVFGYVCWNLNDTMIGQRLEDLASLLDYVSPMLYPSSFQFGIPGYRLPVAYPYEIVHLSLERAQQRTGLPPTRFRPWLQAFRDYGFDRRAFGGAEIRAQITAADRFGSHGWMLWNPHNVYFPDGLQSRMTP